MKNYVFNFFYKNVLNFSLDTFWSRQVLTFMCKNKAKDNYYK